MTNNFRHFGYMLHFYMGDVGSNNTAVDNPNLVPPFVVYVHPTPLCRICLINVRRSIPIGVNYRKL
jgi:hypothetical protein